MRRTTLGPISSSQLNTRQSGNEKGRLSMGKSRLSMGTMMGPNKMTQAASRVMSRRNSNVAAMSRPPRQSISNNSNLNSNRASLQPRMRKSSTATSAGRRSSIFGGSRGMKPDPRPITDKAFMHSSIRVLIKFLSERQYDQSLSPQLLTRPMKKDFHNIISFLFQLLDPNMAFTQKFEEDVATIFRQIKYPFTISKTALVAVGSPHTWPVLLASISWLIELLSYDDEVQMATDMNRDFEGDASSKVIFEYLGSAYKSFLSGDDEYYASLEEQLTEKIETKNEQIQHDVEKIQNKTEAIKKEIEQLENQKSSLPALQSQKKDYISDREKFNDLIRKYGVHLQKLQQRVHDAEEKVGQKDHGLSEQDHCTRELQQCIDHQELSAKDVEHMAQEQTRLREQIQSTMTRREEVQKILWEHDNFVSREMDELERLLLQYHETGMRMKILPQQAKYAGNFDYDVQLNHKNGMNNGTLLSKDLKMDIKPQLMKLKKLFMESLDQFTHENEYIHQELEKHTERVAAAQTEKEMTENSIKKIDQVILRAQESHERSTEEHGLKLEQLETEKLICGDHTSEIHLSQAHLHQIKQEMTELRETYGHQIRKMKKDLTKLLVLYTDHKENIFSSIQHFHQETLELSS